MSILKDLVKSIEDEESFEEGDVEVYADSVKQVMDLASKDLEVDISMLDYEVIEKGVKGLFGIGRKPYRVLVKLVRVEDEYKDILEIEKKLSKEKDLLCVHSELCGCIICLAV